MNDGEALTQTERTGFRLFGIHNRFIRTDKVKWLNRQLSTNNAAVVGYKFNTENHFFVVALSRANRGKCEK